MSLNVQYSVFLLFTLICAGYSHPQCLDSQAPFTPEPDTPFQLCLEYQSFGCCNDDSVITQHYQGVMGLISASDRVTCGLYIQNILCQICSPYAAHLYDAEGSPTPKSFPSLCPSYLAGFTARCSHLIPYITLNPTAVLAPSLTYCYPDTLNSDNRTTNLGNINSEDNCDVLCVQEVANNFFPATSAKHANDGTHRLFLVEQRGMIWIYLSNFTKISPPFLDWRPSIFARSRSYDERGLLDLAFHPEFRQNGRFYIYYTTRTEVGHVTRLSELTVSTMNMNIANASSERVILDIPQPALNHNGGSILFYQGFLYLFTGDGGKGGDPYGNGQNLNVLLGKALRIDVDVANRRYGIPNDNPFLSNPNARPEIYAYGLRNPWKCTLDRGDPLTNIGYGRIFCGDVGQDDFEEVDIMERGGNYGWNQLEGHACFLHSCIHYGDYVPPIHVYDHSIGRSVTGGFVYRGCESPNLNGVYIFGDWDNGRLFYLREQSTGWSRRNICMGSADYCVGNGLSGSYARYISSFAEDEKGEVYIISSIKAHKDMQGGRMYKIVDPSRRGSPTQCTQAPTQSVVFNPGTQFMAYEPITADSLEVRLVNERDGQLKRGRVEIRKPGGVWGTVCDDRWDIRDGHVVCKMAGFKAARRVFRRSHFGVGSGPIYLVDLGCTSNEISLLECVHRGWNQTNCNHFEDAGVLCI